MTRFLKLNHNPPSKVSIGNLITIGLVCLAGDERFDGCLFQQHLQSITSKGLGPFIFPQTASIERTSGQSSGQGSSTAQPFQSRSLDFEVVENSVQPRYDHPRLALPEAPLIYPPNSHNWIVKYKRCNYEIPNFFQITSETSSTRVLEILRERSSRLSFSSWTELWNHCEAVFRTIEAEAGQPRVDEGIGQWVELVCATDQVVQALTKGRGHCSSEAGQNVAGSADIVSAESGSYFSETMRKKNEIRLTKEQFDFLWYFEPAIAYVAFTTDRLMQGRPKPYNGALSLLTLIRTALLRHHVLTRLSSIRSVKDNRALTIAVHCSEAPVVLPEELAIQVPRVVFTFLSDRLLGNRLQRSF
eukprot:Blabericola_migrator_1__12355@NODE_774_length_6567_cov_442_935846_g550_i0_p2_GENE_NODE_774_length_6567_cov_442_935846_g550_i0NODE_774_length_6567_cov_442_935846_g550_i0_p2_ORF_typecomplete_len358_score39_28_NODE_774_length_6567_cov_442_935846_g550_i030934166